MCVILDTNSVSKVIGQKKSASGDDLFNWIVKGGIKLVAGKMLLSELNKISAFKQWFNIAEKTGNAIRLDKEDDDMVEKQYKRLVQQGECKSNDQHIIALAQISGARLLYTHDTDLIPDFKKLIKEGRIYPTGKNDSAKKARKRIHQRKNLCARYDKRE